MPKMSKTVVASLLVIAIQAPPHAQLSNQSNGDNGPAIGATVVPLAVRVDAAGNIYIVDNQNGRVRKVTAGSGIIETVAGSTRGIGGDGGPAKAAQLQTPKDLVIDSAGNLYIADLNGNQIRKVTTDGIISTFARTPNPVGLAMDSSGTLYISQLGNRVVKIAPGTRQRALSARAPRIG